MQFKVLALTAAVMLLYMSWRTMLESVKVQRKFLTILPSVSFWLKQTVEPESVSGETEPNVLRKAH